MKGPLRLHGQVWLTLETVAECYRVEVSWVREVYDHGLLGRGEPAGGSTAVPAAMLERMARILRWYRIEGINLHGIERLLDELGG